MAQQLEVEGRIGTTSLENCLAILTKVNICASIPSIHSTAMYMYVYQMTWTRMFIAALFIILELPNVYQQQTE